MASARIHITKENPNLTNIIGFNNLKEIGEDLYIGAI